MTRQTAGWVAGSSGSASPTTRDPYPGDPTRKPGGLTRTHQGLCGAKYDDLDIEWDQISERHIPCEWHCFCQAQEIIKEVWVPGCGAHCRFPDYNINNFLLRTEEVPFTWDMNLTNPHNAHLVGIVWPPPKASTQKEGRRELTEHSLWSGSVTACTAQIDLKKKFIEHFGQVFNFSTLALKVERRVAKPEVQLGRSRTRDRVRNMPARSSVHNNSSKAPTCAWPHSINQTGAGTPRDLLFGGVVVPVSSLNIPHIATSHLRVAGTHFAVPISILNPLPQVPGNSRKSAQGRRTGVIHIRKKSFDSSSPLRYIA
ncbi:hypothetical protein B0H11DRAFT_1923896 [Mycena galericulata]|nr:hypothetical protein B0H11DRAFT_1923896 [Mycena galericulata]